MAMRLSARNFEEVEKLVSSFTEEINQSGKDIMDQVNEYFSTDYYEQVFKLTESFIDSFKNELKGKIDDWLDEWQDGENSFVRFAEKIKAGETTIDDARIQQQDIIALFQDIKFPEEIEAKNQVSEINTEKIKELADSIIGIASQVSDELSNYENKLSDIFAENQFYIGVSHVVLPTSRVYADLLENFGRSVKVLAEKTSETGEAAKSRSEDQIQGSVSNLTQKAQGISDELLAKMNTLFDVDDL